MVSTPDGDRAQEKPEGILWPLVSLLGHRIERERAAPVFRRDPELIHRLVGLGARYTSFFSPEVRGIEHLPQDGPVVVVGNHSGLFYMPDVWITWLAIAGRRGIDQPVYGLTYDLLFAIPGVEALLRRLGAIPAGGEEAEAGLTQGALVLVYPGGDYEACRPWSARDRIDFAGRHGFVKLVLRTGVPVVPVVAHGAQHIVVVLSRGERLAHALGLNQLRIKVFPVLLGPPFGLNSALTPPLPLPAAITVEFLPSLDWASLGPEAAEDEAVVDDCYREITSLMQLALDRLRAEHPHPVLRGLSHLLRNGPAHVEVPAA